MDAQLITCSREILGTNMRLQRIFTEYKDQLGMI